MKANYYLTPTQRFLLQIIANHNSLYSTESFYYDCEDQFGYARYPELFNEKSETVRADIDKAGSWLKSRGLIRLTPDSGFQITVRGRETLYYRRRILIDINKRSAPAPDSLTQPNTQA